MNLSLLSEMQQAVRFGDLKHVETLLKTVSMPGQDEEPESLLIRQFASNWVAELNENARSWAFRDYDKSDEIFTAFDFSPQTVSFVSELLSDFPGRTASHFVIERSYVNVTSTTLGQYEFKGYVRRVTNASNLDTDITKKIVDFAEQQRGQRIDGRIREEEQTLQILLVRGNQHAGYEVHFDYLGARGRLVLSPFLAFCGEIAQCPSGRGESYSLARKMLEALLVLL